MGVHRDTVNACMAIAERLQPDFQSSAIDAIVREAFANKVKFNGLGVRDAESQTSIYRKLREAIHSTDWRAVGDDLVRKAEENAAELVKFAKSLKSATWVETNQLGKNFASWYWVDAYFYYSWVGRNNRQAIAQFQLKLKRSQKPATKKVTKDQEKDGTQLAQQRAAKAVTEISDLGIQIVHALSEPMFFDMLHQSVSSDASNLLATITKLELKKLIKRIGPLHFALTPKGERLRNELV